MKYIDTIEKIKNFHANICVVILLFISLFVLVSGLNFKDTVLTVPWWFSLLYGWSGIIVALKITNILHEKK
jgi:hypothetical protein